MKVLAVSGVPGTGKTTLAKNFAQKLNFLYVDVNKIISRHRLSEGYDKKRKTKVVDVAKLNKVLIEYIDFFKKNKFIDEKFIESALMPKARSTKYINEFNALTKNIKKITFNKNNKKYNGIIIDSHLSHYLPRKYVDLCIVTKCDIDELNKRLKKRKYPKNKIQENIQAEIFDICHNEAIKQKQKVIVIDTTKSFINNKKFQSVIEIFSDKEPKC